MLLRQFVKETLLEIMNGVQDACDQKTGNGQIVRTGAVKFVEFDVAVTESESVTSEKQGGVSIWKANIGGKSGNESSNVAVSRIKFAVPVRFSASG